MLSSALSALRRPLALTAFVVAVGAFTLHFGLWQISGYDLSPLIDLQWRLARGEVPGRDFVYTLPFTLALALKAYGLVAPVRWSGLLWVNILLLAACAGLIGRYWPRRLAPEKRVYALGLIALPVLYTSHIWHSASAQMIAVTSCVLTLNLLLDAPGARRPWRDLALAGVTGACVFSKQNCGLPLEAALALALALASLGDPSLRPAALRWLILSLAGTAATAGVILLALGAPPASLIHSFTDVAGRSRLSPKQIEAVAFKPLAIAGLALMAAAFLALKPWLGERLRATAPAPVGLFASLMLVAALGLRPPDSLLALIILAGLWLFLDGFSLLDARPAAERCVTLSALAVSLIPMATDWDSKLNDAPLLLFALMLGFDLDAPRRRAAARLLAACALVLALVLGAERQRMATAGPFYEADGLSEVKAGYFTGLRAGPWFQAIRAEIRTALAARPATGDVWCGPRIEFCYADAGLASPRGLPLWWHPGSSYGLASEAAIVRQFRADRFAQLILLHDDRTRLPPGILTEIDRTYVPTPGFKVLDIYRRRPEPGLVASTAPPGQGPGRAD